MNYLMLFYFLRMKLQGIGEVIDDGTCSTDDENSGSSLGIGSVAGVFATLGLGVGTAMMAVVCEKGLAKGTWIKQYYKHYKRLY